MAANRTNIPLTGPINLLVRLGHGSVVVAAREGLAEATVRLTPRNQESDVLDRVTVELQGRTLLVSGPRQGGLADLIGGWRRDRDGIEAVIEVPTGTPLKVATASADITVTGQCGDADLATAATGIRLDTVAGDLRLRCGRAESRIGMVTGSVQLRAGNGTAHLGEVGGRLECAFGAGELIADVVRGEMRVRAGSCSARVGTAYGDVDIAFGSGPITIGLPAGVSARVDVTSGSGQVHSDLPIEQAPMPGGHPITVRARTGSGDVRLLRAAAAA